MILNRKRISAANIVNAAERRYQHQQRRFRQVKIGDQAFDNIETKPRQDKNIRLTKTTLQRPAYRRAFQGAQCRRAHCRYAPALRAGLFNCIGRLLRHLVPLAVHDVIGKIFHSHRLKRAPADVQRDIGNPNTLRAQRIE